MKGGSCLLFMAMCVACQEKNRTSEEVVEFCQEFYRPGKGIVVNTPRISI